MGEPRTPAREARTRIHALDGEALARAFAGGAEALRRQADAIDAINVFPVPDGDTGTNMLSTMRAAVEEVARADAHDAAGVTRAAAQGALMGAKGNSGVILSQILAGLAEAAPEGAIGGAALAAGLAAGRAKAYAVVSSPREGTILTAIASAADAARDAAGAADAAAEGVLAAAVDACEAAVARTPDLLPVLKEAGVVDSGAQGLFILLEGMLHALRGEAQAAHEGGFGAIDITWLAATQQVHAHGGETSGYCTEFVVAGEGLDPDAIRARLRGVGESVLVIGGGDVARVHVHTHDPEAALAYGRSLGTLRHEKVDDMEAQFRALAARRTSEATPVEGVAVVAVASGEGLQELLRSLGAVVVHGGPTMNPSAGAIRAAIETTEARDVIVLPNDKNIVLAAKLALDGWSGRNVRVVETTSVPQGVAAAIALNNDATLDENIEEMTAAARSVRTAEITRAARETTLQGRAIRAGQPIGIIDNELRAVEETIGDAVRACVAAMIEGRAGAIVTLYAGEGVREDEASALADELRTAHGCDVEVVMGGQPHYPYIVGVE